VRAGLRIDRSHRRQPVPGADGRARRAGEPKFKGKLTLSDIQPPNSYSISFEGQGGAAGFAKGGAQVRLSPQGESTRLAYDVKANVGGKLAQIGSRLVDAAARKVADDFFRNFNQKVGELHGKSNPPG